MSEEAVKTISGTFEERRGAQGGSMRGMDGRGRCRAPSERAAPTVAAPARMAYAALLSCALSACGGGDDPVPATADPTPPPAQAGMTAMAGSSASGGSVSVAVGSGAGAAATNYFKAPNAGAFDQFGAALTLSEDGSVLAVGAPNEGSSAIGVFAPASAGYQDALDSDGTFFSGAAYVYRRSGSAWSLEAFVKAPNAGGVDYFGFALALSADGSTLAVGAPREDSASAGVFVPGGAGYQAALDDDGGDESGAAYVYRRSGSAWSLEAFVKAPNAGGGVDEFGTALALSKDGSTLAVGAYLEASSATGVFAPGGAGYQAALDSDGDGLSGGGYVYRRSDSAWSIEAFIKAPNAGAFDFFGSALALSADGSTLAVGAYGEDSSAIGVFAPGGAGYQAALDDDGARNGGAAYVYRRSGSAWSLEAFVKAPKAGGGDRFGAALALSGDGAALAVGATGGASSATGVFAPGGAGYQDALDDDGADESGGAYVYRRSDSAWSLEAFVKAPNASGGDKFGAALALSGDGAALAVGATGEASSATGVFAPGGAGYQDALDGGGASGSGGAYVYRRSSSAWSLEAFVKAPNAGGGDEFGAALELSGDGAILAVGADEEDGAALDQPVDGGSADAGNAVGGSGAAYLY